MRDKFIPGAGTTYAPGDTGGAVDHTHGFTSSGHTHAIEAAEDIEIGANFGNAVITEVATGTADPGSSLPRYYSLAYIMFIGGT